MANLLFVFTAFVTFPASAQLQQAWAVHYNNGITNGTHQAAKMLLDSSGNIYITGTSQNASGGDGYITIKYAPKGTQVWAARYDSASFPSAGVSAMVLDSSGNVFVTGNAVTIKYGPSGNQLWTAPYAGTALACDSLGNTYIAGLGTNFNTVKLGPDGNQLSLITYVDVGPTISQSDAGNAIAVDTNGNVYVTGYDTTTAGGTEIVLIKYSPLVLHKRADGSILLQAQGYPGEKFDIQASADLLNWLDLGIVTADTNGLMQFADTNAPNYPARFYYTNPQ